MFGYKRSIFASKAGSWLITLCQISREKCQTNQKSHFAMQNCKEFHLRFKTVKICAVHRWVHISTCSREQWISSSQSQRSKGPSRLSLATEAKANVCHGMGVQQSKRHGWLAYVRKYYWHGGIYWNCTEIQYILPSRWYLPWEVHVIRSRQCQLSFWMCYNSMFRRDRVNVLDLSVSFENVWPVMKRRIRQRRSRTAELLKSCIKQDWTKILLAKL